MRVAFSTGYYVELPAKHRFPMGKYPAVRKLLISEGLVGEDHFIEPQEADWPMIEAVHTPDYIAALASGSVDAAFERRLGFPWSAQLVRRARLATQGTLLAALNALQHGVGANCAGGTHHAFADRGEGFCVLNDVAVTIRELQSRGTIKRAAVVDLDVHQGNGTAAIFAADESVFTFSMHGAKNYPFLKAASKLDVGLPDCTDDTGYLAALADCLPRVCDSRPDVVFYLAGVDVVAGDRFGRLALTEAGLARRDRMVLEICRRQRVPVVITLAGGYANTVERTAELHVSVFREAVRVFGRC
jgi:acetoin utilization deacetylase AcuC-like enzyme